MKFKVTLGSLNIDVVDATPAEMLEFTKGVQASAAKQKDVVETTTAAIANGTQKRRKRAQNIHWDITDLVFMAKMAVDLGPDAKVPASTIAHAMSAQAHNVRKYDTLYAMAYNVARYLRDNKQGSLSRVNLKMLADNGYTGGMMRATRSNLLGNPENEVRHLSVREA